jgi:hypothetical protein
MVILPHYRPHCLDLVTVVVLAAPQHLEVAAAAAAVVADAGKLLNLTGLFFAKVCQSSGQLSFLGGRDIGQTLLKEFKDLSM